MFAAAAVLAGFAIGSTRAGSRLLFGRYARDWQAQESGEDSA
jgi:hypothetical protein